MKKMTCLFVLICMVTHNLSAQEMATVPTSKSAEKWHKKAAAPYYDALYFDAGGGYFPQEDNASWAAQMSFGTQLNAHSSLGIGGSYWGRIQTYKRAALGLGLQYRLSFWGNFIGKIEGGYLLKRTMHDGTLHQDMVFVAESSRPFYYKMDLNVRFLRYFTVGVSASQSGNLMFKRFADQKSETIDAWRINAFTVQLGIALNKIQ